MKGLFSKARRFLTEEDARFFYLDALGALRRMPDEEYLRRAFRYRLGYELNLENPVNFNEKLQWLKLHDRNPAYTRMVDKVEAKGFVAGVIGEEHVIPTLGVWERARDVDFGALPEQFVIKCSHNSGGVLAYAGTGRSWTRRGFAGGLRGHSGTITTTTGGSGRT